jgi:hypothetical protein
MFSVTERKGMRLISWKIVEMPPRCAISGEDAASNGAPFTVMVPASLRQNPFRTLIIVDLPAPFWPIRP